MPDALAAPYDLELLPPVQMDRLAVEQLARLSRLGRLPAAVLSAQANVVGGPQRRQPHAESMSAGLPAAQGGSLTAERQHRHQPHSAERDGISNSDFANWRRHAADSHTTPCNQTRTDCAAAGKPVDHQQITIWRYHPAASVHKAAAGPPFMLQQPAAIPGDSRVCQALRTLRPDAHTIGDLVAVLGDAALAQVILKAANNMF